MCIRDRSLDLTENARTGKKHGSLYWLLDESKTAMGGRLLRAWIQKPLMDRHRIEERQEIIQVFLDHFFERSDLADRLKGVYDIERLASRVSFGKTTPKDLLQLGETLRHVPSVSYTHLDVYKRQGRYYIFSGASTPNRRSASFKTTAVE